MVDGGPGVRIRHSNNVIVEADDSDDEDRG